jgi:beta-glucosidase
MQEPGQTAHAARRIELGATLTATELEGCAPGADWSRWIRSGRAPAPTAPFPFTESWREDLEQLAGLGIDSIAVTLEWASLEPRPGRYDEDAIEHRHDLLVACRALGLTTWAYLVDGTLPGWFVDDEGGFGDDRARGLLWPRHIDWIGERYGDLVDGWVPQREPIRWALRRYLRGTAPPGQRDSVKAIEAVRAAVLADGEAWRLLAGTAPVATHQTARPVTAERATAGTENLKARPRARHIERLLWRPWLSALTDGRLAVDGLPTREVDHLRGAFDRVIVELRPGIEVAADGGWRPQAPDPSSMAEMLRRVADELDEHEIVGAGDLLSVVDDGRARPDHVQAVLDLTAEAADETSVVGWWQTSPIDGYHWLAGSSARPGLITADRRETDAAKAFTRQNAR